MSDGECHYVEPVTRQPCCHRFSQSDTHCRSCGKPKWLYRNRDGRPLVRQLAEYIAAHERGRRPLANLQRFQATECESEPESSTIQVPDGWRKHPDYEEWEKRAGRLRGRVIPLRTHGADYMWGVMECDPSFPDFAELTPRQYTVIEEGDTVPDEDGAKAMALAEAAFQRIVAQRG